MRWPSRMLSLVGALTLFGCPLAPMDLPTETDAGAGSGGAPSGDGTDQAIVDGCLACHDEVAADWANPSSHRLLFDCVACHGAPTAEQGPDHVSRPACSSCHSEAPHPDGGVCVDCHQPHGSANIYLVREIVAGAAVHFTAVEGASADGLARAGVPGQQAGTGLCEICHTSTSHYDAAGQGSAHYDDWCVQCHGHAGGFAPP